MSLPLKMGVGACGAAGCGAGCVCLTVYLADPEWAPLTEDKGFDTTYKGKYGEKYGLFLVGIDIDNKTETDNFFWWKWSYKNKYLVDIAGETHKPSGLFKSGINSYDDLKQKCKGAYLTEESKIKDNTVTDTEYSKKDIWRYCSDFEDVPKTISESGDSDYTGKFGSTNKEKLASTKNNDNEWFWRWNADKFFGSNQNPIRNESNNDFKDLYKSSIDYKEQSKRLREACEAVYKKGDSDVTSYKTEVFQWCSFKGKE